MLQLLALFKKDISDAPRWLDIENIRAEVNDSEYVLIVRFHDSSRNKRPNHYIYDRLKKRYYKLVLVDKARGLFAKKRIGEAVFHSLFDLYVKGDF